MLARKRRVRCCEALALTVCALAAHASDAGSDLASPGRPAACAAFGADAPWVAAKFTLGYAECANADAAAAPSVRTVGRQAQQLYLYDAQPSLMDLPVSQPAPESASRRAAPATATARQPAPAPSSRTLRALSLAPVIDATARTHDIDPLLLHAIARVESRHDPAAVSPAGAIGVMQVMPATGNRFGAGSAQMLRDPAVNVAVGAVYLKTLQRRYGNDLPLVLAAYNAGEGAVDRYGKHVPPYAETQAYVRQVLAEYTLMRQAAARASGGVREVAR